MRIEVELTQREADVLRRAKITPVGGGDGWSCVDRELESAAIKLNDALDAANVLQRAVDRVRRGGVLRVELEPGAFGALVDEAVDQLARRGTPRPEGEA